MIDKKISDVIAALESNGIEAFLVKNKEEALSKFREVVEEGSEVTNMTSVTLTECGIEKEILESNKYVVNRNKLWDENTPRKDKKILGCVPQWAVGSVNAITEGGSLVWASNTGSQLPAYAFGAFNVLIVAGINKIVGDLDAAMKRIYEYVLPLESERAKKAYGVAGSNVSKLLILNKEIEKGRFRLILVQEDLGF